MAKLLKDKGLAVAPIKMEGYLNIDSGTLSPYRHGEVFVLDDGTECDMDLGTYERMLDQGSEPRRFTSMDSRACMDIGGPSARIRTCAGSW